MLTALGFVFLLIGAGCSIFILIAAFRDEIWKGVVGLVCGLYLLYYGIVEFDAPNKWLIVAGAFFGGAIGSALIHAGTPTPTRF